MKSKKLLALALLSVLQTTACNDLTSENKEDVVFSLAGSGSINDVEYSFKLNAVTADNEFYIKAENTDLEEIWGEWKKVDGKGYILTFDDAYWTEKKTKYNEVSNKFYFTYEVNLDSAYGKNKIKFEGDAGSFKDEYDHVGWGFEPYQFELVGADVMGMTTIDLYITLYEDLTMKLTGSCPLIAVPEKNGTYTFDESQHLYVFTFTGEEPINSTYDEQTNTYSVNVTVNVGMKLPFTLTYTPE